MHILSQFLIGFALFIFLSNSISGNPINDGTRPLLVSARKESDDTNSTSENNEDFNSTTRPVLLIEVGEVTFGIPNESNYTDYNSDKNPEKVEGFNSTSHSTQSSSPASFIARQQRSLFEEEDKSDKSDNSENSSEDVESKEDINSTVIPQLIFIDQEGYVFIVSNDSSCSSENSSENDEAYNKGSEGTSTSTSTSSAGLLAREQRSLGDDKHKSEESGSSESAESKEVISSKLNSNSSSNVRQKRSFGGRKFIPMVFG